MTDAVPGAAPTIDRIEATIAVDLAKKALVAAPVVALALGLWRGPDAALAVGITDWPVFCLVLLGGYFVLLIWELRSVSMSLAYPGLKPKPGES